MKVVNERVKRMLAVLVVAASVASALLLSAGGIGAANGTCGDPDKFKTGLIDHHEDRNFNATEVCCPTAAPAPLPDDGPLVVLLAALSCGDQSATHCGTIDTIYSEDVYLECERGFQTKCCFPITVIKTERTLTSCTWTSASGPPTCQGTQQEFVTPGYKLKGISCPPAGPNGECTDGLED